MRLVKSLLIAILLLVLSNCAGAVAAPELPSDDKIVGRAFGFCPDGVLVVRLYNLYGSPEWVELRVYGSEVEGKFTPLVWIYYPHVDADSASEYVILTAPGSAPQKVSFEEAKALFPNVCDILKKSGTPA